jgi:hypothetical protein
LGLSVDLMGSFASQGVVWSYMAIPPEEAGQADLGFPAIAIGTEVDILIFNGAPEPLHQDVGIAAGFCKAVAPPPP